MDSKCVNTLNCLSYNYGNIDKKLRKINNRIKKLQKEINIIDNLFLEQIAFVWASEDSSFQRDRVKKILGEDIFNTCAFEVETYSDIKNKVQELIDKGIKYIIVTDTASVSTIIDLIFEYKDIQFISINSTDIKFSNISNLKKMLPDNTFMAKSIVEAFSIDYNILTNNINKLNIIGLYDSDGLFSSDLFNQINIQNSQLLNIEIKWFDTFIYNSGNEQQKKQWLNEWIGYLNNLNYSFDLLYISTDNTFINDKINLYPISQYLYKCYFTDALLGLIIEEYSVQPFGSILSKSFFTFIKTEFINLYLLLVDSITSIRCKDFYQIENLYYTKLINFNQNINNIDNFNLIESKQIFTTYTTTNQDEQNYINLINFLTDINYTRFIRCDLELQLIIVDTVIDELNFYETLTTNEKGNYNKQFEIPYNNEIIRFFFYGANILPNNTVYIQDISKDNIDDNINSLNINSLNTKSLNTKSLNTKSLNTKSLNTKSLNTKSLNTKSLNTKSLNTKSLNTNSINTKSVNTKSVGDESENNSDINIITSYNNNFISNVSIISGIIQNDTDSSALFQKTMFNTAFTKSLFYINNIFNLKNASQNFINYIGTTEQESKTNDIYNKLNRVLQNILIFYKWSNINNNSNNNLWTLMYLNQSYNAGTRRNQIINTTNIRILLKLNDGTNKINIGFQNKLGGDSSDINYIDETNSGIIDLTNISTFINTNTSNNNQFNNIFFSSDYYKFDSSTNKWIQNTENNQINMLFDLVKFYLSSFNISTIQNIIKGDCFLSAIMITFSQRYLIKESEISNLKTR
jgi:hypothetical protein